MTEPTAPDDPRPGEGAYLARALREQRISIRGARTHNLKNIDLDLPRNQLVVITGLSGSGKSSLAFDTLYAEGQRRYVESLSAYARQFLGRLDKPDVDLIEGLSPAISIEQKATSHNPRSTVGTVTEIHDYLRLLYARAGTPYCPEHGLPLAAQTVSQMVDTVLALPEDTRLMVLAPVARGRKGEFTELFAQMQALGYVRFRVDGTIHEVENLPQLKKTEKHDIDVVIDRLKVRPDAQQRLAESFEAALRVGQEAAGADGNGRVLALEMDSEREHLFSSKFACPICGFSLPELEPRLFSFNSPIGACPTCDGLGQQEVFDPARVVAFPSLSLASGAIKGWDRRNGYYFAMLESLARHYGFDVEAPFESLPERVRHAVLHGSGEEEIAFSYILDSGANKGKAVVRKHPFEGILPNMSRRYRETDSTVVREDLARLRSTQPCPDCHGTRLRLEARHVRVGEGEQSRAIYEVSRATLAEARAWFEALQLSGAKAEIAGKVVREIATRLTFLNDVGLNYLSLDRSAETLSGGEAQRIRLASQIGSGLTGVMYVLDEPSIGLHQRDNDRLIATLQHLRDIGNSVIVVEHDEDMIRAADHCVDMGPGAGVHGGRVMAQGTSDELSAHPESLTGQYLSGARTIPVPARRTPWLPVLEAQAEPEPPKKGKSRFPETDASRRRAERMAEHRAKQGRLQALRVVGATGHSLKNVSVEFPVGLLTCVTGVSGSGKSTLVNDTLYAAVARQLYRSHDEPAPHEAIEGIEYFDKVINVDQSPIGRTPRSNPATYTGLFTPIRELMAETNTARERGYGPGRFSFNVAGGRCEACQGDGVVKVEMHFLPDVYVPCDVCHGQRYNRETLEVQWKGLNIAQVLELTVEDAHAFFKDVPAIARKLQTLLDVGLSYIRMGQAATTLSGGEAQRVKLAQELSKRDTGRTLYILDEPTTGLHFADIDLLLKVLHQLRDAGNTIVVIEHNLDVIKTADWIIDMGPEGGAGGGTVVAEGTPEEVAANPASHTGRYLARYL
ncbi:excinuclease ABC subunit UvrA [Acidovorax sp. NCPPB 3859]|nr:MULTISPECIES: excinuclease ABC subunit UvrA [unclassified Acidovorax]MDA8452927.1 excinuclease ABC subunit UvrA [Acidovorax sp. GBBC 3297]MDA8462335.1 excinuclease ABC subunit UvrA [Acidovorax sp. GBBC 3333]MDA8467369.1 excinuclease ABC subunit UvrA [Acidovorax sp. GBBC 3332]MDA8472413.1 excinuclease ABC subunit UvrA [Acidovorax sp. GBBC 3299]WCM78595.1 excinuclease ABC subunit UvrA [Acidovorax sp. GBBC 712]